MRPIYVISDNIISPLGLTTAENFSGVMAGESGITLHDRTSLSDHPFYASLFTDDTRAEKNPDHTRFESLLISSIAQALQTANIDAAGERTVLIICSTKGNIELLETRERNEELYRRISLHTSANIVARHFGFTNTPLVISNACISGLMGILTAKRLLSSGMYDTAVVAGADVISKFILSGFQAFQAVSPEPCAPFDKDRKGITLGEGAATVVLSADPEYADKIRVMGGGASNDANHISAPSRTGNELAHIIDQALKESGLSKNEIGFVSAHGTATAYNDEMEAKALTVSGMQNIPVNSLKGFFGHTLGAAGLIESIISMKSLEHNLVLPTRNFLEADPSVSLHITGEINHTPLQHCLKTASGFGGCNAAVVFSKP